jgi:hypothetical protein
LCWRPSAIGRHGSKGSEQECGLLSSDVFQVVPKKEEADKDIIGKALVEVCKNRVEPLGVRPKLCLE